MYKFQLTAAFVLLAVLAGSPLFADHGRLFGADLDHKIDFPHFGNGDDIRSELVLVNLGSASHPKICFYGSDGMMIPSDSVVEVTDDLMVLEDGGLTTTDPIPTLGEITIATNQTGDTVAGSLSVLSASRMNGFLRYSLYNNQGIAGAGVPSSGASHNFIVPVQRRAGGINTGLAIHNLGDSEINISCDLMQGGEVLDDTGMFTLPAKGHVARFIDQIFPDHFADPEPDPEADPEPEEDPAPENGDDESTEEPGEEEPIAEPESELFRGSVACGGSSQITSVALELDSSLNVLTTLPVMLRPSGADFFIN